MNYADLIVAQREFEKSANEFGKILLTVKVVDTHLECDKGFSEKAVEFAEAVERLIKFRVKENVQ